VSRPSAAGELAIVLHSHMPYVEGFLDVAARQGLRLARLD
jgi:hypothetical protein